MASGNLLFTQFTNTFTNAAQTDIQFHGWHCAIILFIYISIQQYSNVRLHGQSTSNGATVYKK